jgi:hypothetical protein
MQRATTCTTNNVGPSTARVAFRTEHSLPGCCSFHVCDTTGGVAAARPLPASGGVAERSQTGSFCPICGYFRTKPRSERHASHARGRWFETTRAHHRKWFISSTFSRRRVLLPAQRRPERRYRRLGRPVLTLSEPAGAPLRLTRERTLTRASLTAVLELRAERPLTHGRRAAGDDTVLERLVGDRERSRDEGAAPGGAA